MRVYNGERGVQQNRGKRRYGRQRSVACVGAQTYPVVWHGERNVHTHTPRAVVVMLQRGKPDPAANQAVVGEPGSVPRVS